MEYKQYVIFYACPQFLCLLNICHSPSLNETVSSACPCLRRYSADSHVGLIYLLEQHNGGYWPHVPMLGLCPRPRCPSGGSGVSAGRGSWGRTSLLIGRNTTAPPSSAPPPLLKQACCPVCQSAKYPWFSRWCVCKLLGPYWTMVQGLGTKARAPRALVLDYFCARRWSWLCTCAAPGDSQLPRGRSPRARPRSKTNLSSAEQAPVPADFVWFVFWG